MKRIKTMPVNVSPPLSNILMNLDVKQLREILIEIISWDATGKDIFDTDYLFQDPIKVKSPNLTSRTNFICQGIPDLTVREYDGDCFLEWVEPNPINQPAISITARVAKILLASKKQPDLYQGIFAIFALVNHILLQSIL